MKRILFILALGACALAGCSAAPKSEPSSADGPRHTISCRSGYWADCYEKAAAACPHKGYVILRHGAGASAAAGGTGGGGRTTMLIECRDWSPR